jgi:hypothetical protein
MFIAQKTLNKTRIKLHNTRTGYWPFQLCYTAVKIGPLSKRRKKDNSSRDEMYERNSGINLERL